MAHSHSTHVCLRSSTGRDRLKVAFTRCLWTTRSRTIADFHRERGLLAGGLWPVAGVDEVGRGPLAGPVCAAAVILDPARLPMGVDDSKRLSAGAREHAYRCVMASATAVAVALASAEEVDAINIRRASLAAMRRAVSALAVAPTYLLIDGNDMPAGLPCGGETLVGGDARALSIAAASVVAKVTRDRLMRRLGVHHPAYGFERHVGYPTRGHLAALRTHGVCPCHRRSFAPVRALLAE